MSYGITSSLLQVRIGPLQGEPFAAALFVRDASAVTGEPETLGSRLNEPRVTFLPLSRDGEVEMLHLGGIAYVESAEELPEVARLLELGVRGEPVEVTLVNGESVHGRLTVMTPPGERRLSDLLNHADRFLLLADRRGGHYVRRDAILRVRSTALRGLETVKPTASDEAPQRGATTIARSGPDRSSSQRLSTHRSESTPPRAGELDPGR